MSLTLNNDTCMFSEVNVILAPTEYKQIRINKWRVKEGLPVCMNQVVFLYEIPATDEKVEAANNSFSKVIYKFKAQRTGVVKKRLFNNGAVVEGGAVLVELMECIHTTVIQDMCADCGADLRQNDKGNKSEASVPMVHTIPDLKVSQKLAQKLGHDDTRRLLKDRKLVLLVDLDQTIIHTTNDNVPVNIKGIYHFQLYGPNSPWYHTRLRPRTLEFLERISKLYELHICTFGARNYAHMIAQILDPDGKFFSHRILSRDECFNATCKTDNLKALFPNGDSMVCIIDDREDVWNMASNLIQVKPYHFFQHTGDINAPPGLEKHELDGEGVDFKNFNKLQKNIKADEKDVTCDEIETLGSLHETSDTKDTQLANDDIENDSIKMDTSSNEAISTDNDVVSTTESTESTNQSEVESDTKKIQKENKILRKDSTESKKLSTTVNEEDMKVEIEDPDDYLLYLETILTSIYSRFYSIYDESKEIPDLKIIVPKIRSEVLTDCNLVFSGLVPTNMKLQHSRAYFIARSLGAHVNQSINEETTHLVAVTSGTFKVNSAKKNSKIKLVNASWLWTCAERWEHVEEKLFPLDRKIKSKRQPPAHCHSPEHVVNYSGKSEISSSSSAQQNASLPTEKFIDTINPLLAFSNADLADMNEEFEQFFDSNSSSEEECPNIDNPPINRSLKKRKLEEIGEERARNFFTRSVNTNLESSLKCNDEQIPIEEDNKEHDDSVENKNCVQDDVDSKDEEIPSEKFHKGENLPADLEVGSESNDNSDDSCNDQDNSEWNMMGAALEREFLGLN